MLSQAKQSCIRCYHPITHTICKQTDEQHNATDNHTHTYIHTDRGKSGRRARKQQWCVGAPRRCISFRLKFGGDDVVCVTVVVPLCILSQPVKQACACLLLWAGLVVGNSINRAHSVFSRPGACRVHTAAPLCAVLSSLPHACSRKLGLLVPMQGWTGSVQTRVVAMEVLKSGY